MIRSISLALVFCKLQFAQVAAPAGDTLLNAVQSSKTEPVRARVADRPRWSLSNLLAPYRGAVALPFHLGSSVRAASLVQDGALRLSLSDAIALAVENNLNVEIARYNLSIAGTESQRAQGGGTLRGLDLSVAEAPTGVGGPGSPLLNTAAASVTPTTATVNDLTSLNVLTETQTNLSVQSPAAYSAGPNLPVLDASLVGQSTFFQRSNAALLTTSTLGSSGTTVPSTQSALDFVTANYALVQGFGTGTQIEVDVSNAAQALFANKSHLDPFSQPNTSVTLTQPLLRGFGSNVNLRFLRIAQLDRRISGLSFYQQLISTVYGVARLYYDLVSLNENVAVKQEGLTAARKLLEDDRAQLEQGTLAPLDVTQAQALVTSSELDLIQAQGLVRQQEVILKSQLSPQGTGDPGLAGIRVVPTDVISVPSSNDIPAVPVLIAEALHTRSDLAGAGLQVELGRISVNASQNGIKPEIDLVGNFQTRGSSEVPFSQTGTQGNGLVTSPADLGVAGLRLSRIYQAGIQLNLPLRNRAAESDAARDILQLRQAEARTQLLANQVRAEVENASVALETARSALQAAAQSRQYQEQLLQAEQDRLSVGASTNLLVVQQQSYLAQARSTEVAARSVWVKAHLALDRAVGDLLEKNGVQVDDAIRGEIRAAPADAR